MISCMVKPLMLTKFCQKNESLYCTQHDGFEVPLQSAAYGVRCLKRKRPGRSVGVVIIIGFSMRFSLRQVSLHQATHKLQISKISRTKIAPALGCEF